MVFHSVGACQPSKPQFLSFPKDLLFVFKHRREQIADDPARACFDLDSDLHAGGQIDEFVLHLHLRAIKRDPRCIVQFLALRFTAGRLAPEFLSSDLSCTCGLSRVMASCDTLSTLPCRSPYRVALPSLVPLSAHPVCSYAHEITSFGQDW